MASVSSSRDLWDPYRVLDVDPSSPYSTCVGFAVSTGSRCKWRFNTEQFDTFQRATAVERLKAMSEMHPSQVTLAALYSLARNTLCRDFHQWQADAKSTEWEAKIEDYLLHEHNRGLAVVRPVTQPRYRLDDATQLQYGIAQDKHASEQEMKQLVGQMDVVKQDLAKRDRTIEQLGEQMDAVKYDLAKRDRHVEYLAKQVNVVNQELAEREDKVPSLEQPQKVKRGFWRALGRKFSRIMRK
ncbi:hypothetical protein HO173_000883 [Letharia columbiana]|uniref:Uncharacterized protein n=1 Tax=Letharia columbiana TaxID=112416 RepID=A0A8H6G5R4_9LECA|nr:uncharacterized protein HO173_000883 [Letharia columbiana]KAF6241089.1 hypothetical protein HO173_000883 [Letharia columbiana]